MQNSMPLPGNGGANTNSKRKKTRKWNLLNLLTTWFLSEAGKPVIVDPTATGGATDDDWRDLVKQTRVRIPPEQLAKPWGQMSRCDFLNWCEDTLPVDRRPTLFSSQEEALAARDFANLFEVEVNESKSQPKRFEISVLHRPASENGGDEPPDSIA